MTRFSSLISAALAATSVVALASAANAAVIFRPTITVPVVRPSVPVVHPVVPTVHPVIAAPKPVTPSVHTTTASTHAPASVSSTHTPPPDPNSVPWAKVGATMTLDPNVPVPPHTGPAIAAVLDGKPVIKLTDVRGNETTVYYLTGDQKRIVAAISSISTVPPQNVATTQPPAPSKPPAGSVTTFTPTSYPEIKGAGDVPIGYVGPQGPVYFPNGRMPPGYSLGPNNTIETYIKTTTVPPQNVATTQPQQQSHPQQPAPSKPPATTFTPTSYPEIKDAYGAPIGYVGPQGPVYFPNGQMPPGYSTGPNNTIETYIKS